MAYGILNAPGVTQPDLDAHTGNKSNPHGVTAAQAGAVPNTVAGVSAAINAGYTRIDISNKTVDINTYNLSDGKSNIQRYIEKTSGGAANITNIPVTGAAFILDVEAIRYNNTTDYVTMQTFRSISDKTHEYVRYCTNGTWDSWTKRVFTDTNTTYSNFVKSGSGAKAGLVPAPSTTAGTTKYLREDGSWAVPPNTNTTYSAATQSAAGLMSAADKTKLDGVATGATKNANMTGATSSAAGAAGLVPAPAAGKNTAFLRGDGTWATPTNTTYSAMTGATSSAAGKAGLVPAPAAGKQSQFLRGDGTWQTPTNTTYSNFVKSGSGAKAGLVPAPSTTAGTTKYLREDGSWAVPPNTNTTYSAATQSAAGLMSAADKTKLDGVATGATKNANMTGATSSAAGAAGLVPAPAAEKNTAFLRGDGTWATPTNTTYSAMTGATSSAAGKAGLVPAPVAGKQSQFLRGDGTWQTPTNTTYSNFVKSGSGAKAGLVTAPSTTAGTTKYLREDGSWAVPPNTTYSAATTSAAGLMSAADKEALDALNVLPSSKGYKCLWSNSSFNSSNTGYSTFASQSITLSESVENYRMIVVKTFPNSAYKTDYLSSSTNYWLNFYYPVKLYGSFILFSAKVPKGLDGSDKPSGLSYRLCHFSGAYLWVSTGSADDSSSDAYCIPTEVYGFL